MSYHNGGDVAQLIDKMGMLDQQTAAAIAKQALCGLSYLHLSDVVHQDFKADNLVLAGNLNVTIIDFGIARKKGDLRVRMGTPQYMCPELYTPCWRLCRHAHRHVGLRRFLLPGSLWLFPIRTGCKHLPRCNASD